MLYNQYLLKQISQLLLFIAKHIPLEPPTSADSVSPNYQKFKVDKLPKIIKFQKVDYKLLIEYYLLRYHYAVKPVKHHNCKDTVPSDVVCPRCSAPHDYIYDNNGGRGNFLCKVCSQSFNHGDLISKSISLACPFCGHTLVSKKDRKNFRIHKCVNLDCSYYLHNLSLLPDNLPDSDKYKFKLHYIYREFTTNFFSMDLKHISNRASSFDFKKFNPHILGLCLTYNVNLKLSTRQTARALEEVHGVSISHTTVANYALTASAVLKPFIDSFDYKPSNILAADETYTKVKGIKRYVWLVMDACKKSILGYQVSSSRDVGPCILTMRMAFDKFKSFPQKVLKFIADGYSAYPLAQQQFELSQNKFFNLIQVIGLANDDEVSSEFRWVKQIIERLNRTFKVSYRPTCGYGSDDGAASDLSLWVAYYNFLRPHPYSYWKPLNYIKQVDEVPNMPAKWQMLLFLGQQTIISLQT